jgi:dipeptidyl-peptidase 4
MTIAREFPHARRSWRARYQQMSGATMDISAFPRQFARTQHFTLGVPRAFTLSPDGQRVLFLRTRGGEDRVTCLWLQADGPERLLVDPLILGGAPGDMPEAERIRRERARESAAGVVAYSADARRRRSPSR